MNISPSRLVLHCYAEKRDNQWQAFCLDLTLAAQASSFDEVKHKLEHMILDYVQDALCGQDKAHVGKLLNRRAPFAYWAKYYWYVFLCQIGSIHREFRRLFKMGLPLTISHCQ
ncbi:DUF1902 domain-containing protein [Sulfuricaulis sp.]|uniref:DUF1902 domain-containing protein n=1 Tax=Sulfuricaulis sp. TaxID=2003553 RepID=UPI00355A5187